MSSSSPDNPASHALRGYLYIAAATFFWGLSAALGKLVFTGRLIAGTTPLDPIILAQTRTTISFLVLFPLLRLIRARDAAPLTRPDLIRALIVGVIGIAGSNYFYYLAIEKSTVATAIILQYSAPIWVLLYMVLRGRQRATPARLAGVALAVLGAPLAIGAFSGGDIRLNLVGVAAALAAALTFSFYNVAGSALVSRIDRWLVIVAALGGAALFWLFVNPPWKVFAAGYSAAQWGFLVVFAFTSMLIPFSLYFSGLRHLDATRAIVTSCLEPVWAIGFAAAFAGERVTLLQVAGMVIVLAATIVIQLRDSATAKLTPED